MDTGQERFDMTISPPIVKNIRKKKVPYLRIGVHIASWLPAAWLTWVFFYASISVDPTQYIERFSGQVAIVFLILSLACTPLNTYLHFREAVNLRRPLGLYAFFYSSLHFLYYSGVDYLFNMQYLRDEIFGKPYLLVGLLALIILLPLAATSFKSVMKFMGHKWRRLHSVVYLAGVLVVLHYSWAKKGDLFSLSGEQLFPALAGLIVIVLLVLRLPFVRQGYLRLRESLSAPRRSEAVAEPVKSQNTGPLRHRQ
jgi:methionine sulfoxide reductase heme-binding subunit